MCWCTFADMAQLGFFKITNDVKRVAVDKGKQRFPGVSVIADAGSEVSHPTTHRGANFRLRQLPLCLFQRRLCGINTGLHRFNIEVSGIEFFGRNKIL